ncbi:MAG: B12-binding domain-containing radical SAM protein [Planctomycetes bacterium]|nr:B12-binding domain-containing radical SAM protein [Planctomycetota bacterium]
MRIGLIAMSGVRAVDPELMRAGLTLPGFVERIRVIASLPSLGLLTLAGMTPPVHEIAYHEARDLAEAANIPVDFDLVAISSFSAQIRQAYALADRLRASGVRVVLGGPHVSVLPDEAGAHADAVVIGEGELSWPDVLADAQRGALQPRYGERGKAFDLTTAPMPRFDLLDPARYNRIPIQTSRGCPHRCEFCASTPLMTAGYRQKTPRQVLAEIDAVRERWPHPFIEFADDNSFVDRAWWKALLVELIPRQVRWFTECDLSVAEDPALLDLLYRSGCAQVLIGLESPVATGLGGIELRGDWKLKRFDRYRAAIARIQAHGVSVNGCFILGLDGHGPDIFAAVEQFVATSGLAEVQITVQTPFPGTVLHERLAKAGRLLDPGNWDLCTLFDVAFTPTHMSVDELRTGFRALIARLYSDANVASRRATFRAARRSGRERTLPT